MANLKSTIVNAVWLASDRVARLVLNFIAGILITRALGPTDYGLLSYGQALIFLITPIATVGLPEIVVRELSRRSADSDPGESLEIVANALAVRAASGLLSIIIMVVLAFVAEPDNITAKLVIIAYSFSIAPQALDVIESGMQAKGLFRIVSLARTVNSLAFAAIKIASAFLFADVIWFAALYGLEVLVFAGVYYALARRYLLLPSWCLVKLERMRNLVSASLPLMLRLLTIAIYMRIDQVLVKELMGSERLGVYSVAIRVSELWYFVPTAIMAAALPRLTQSYELGIEAYERELRNWMRIMMLIAIPMALGLSLMSNIVIDLLFGAAYAEAGAALAVQAWAGVFVAIGVATGPWFINTGMLRYGFYQAGIGAVASISLNLLLIPRFGLLGASYGMVISYAISAMLCNALFRDTRRLFVMQLKAMVFR